eukprot:Sdes_comp20765_c0_seq3m16770
MSDVQPLIHVCVKKQHTSLNLSHKGLRQFLLPEKEADTLKHLSKLHLNDNQLTELPSELGNIVNITEITLDNNSLCGLSASFVNLKQITVLTLSGNPLKRFPLQVLELPLLQSLWLNSTGIEELPDGRQDKGLSCLTQLRRLSLADNNLSFIPADMCLMVLCCVFIPHHFTTESS